MFVVSVMVGCPAPTVLHNGSAVKNAWRINNHAKEKAYIIFAKTAEVKEVWMTAFERERKRVKEDQEKGEEWVQQ